MILKRKIIAIAKWLFVAVILFFIAHYICKNVGEIRHYHFHIKYQLIVLAIGICLVHMIGQTLVWYYITRKAKCDIGISRTIVCKVSSEFGKYVPGKMFGYGLLLYYYSKENTSKRKVAFCMMMEVIASVVGSIVVILASTFFTDIALISQFRLLAVLGLVALLILMNPRSLEYFSNIAMRLLKREPVRFEMTHVQVIIVVALYVVNFFVFGLSFFVFVNAFCTVPARYFMYLTGSFAVSGIIGMFALFVPAGLGIREGVLIVALKELMPSFVAGIISLSSRIWLIGCEITLFAIVYVCTGPDRKRRQRVQ